MNPACMCGTMLGINTSIRGTEKTIVNHSSFQLFFVDSAMIRSQSAVDWAAVVNADALAWDIAVLDSTFPLTQVPARLVIAVTKPIMY